MEQRLLLVDDDREFIALLTDFLSSEGFAITSAHDGQEALKTLEKSSFDLCVLDVMMPKLNGVETLKQIQKEYPSLPVLMLTAKSEPIDRILGLELGADDYLIKPPEPRELSARIKAILRRTQADTSQDQNGQQHNKLYWDDQKRLFFIEGQEIDLTGIEYEVTKILAKSTGKIVSKEEISLVALQRTLLPFDRSLDVHISNIRKKIADFDVTIKSVRGRGYQMIA